MRSAYDRYKKMKEDNPDISNGVYKEVFLRVTNPIILNDLSWEPCNVSFQLLDMGIISQYEFKQFSKLDGFFRKDYDSIAAYTIREYLKYLNYDGIIYNNRVEDVGNYSVMVFDADQIITVAENGVAKDGIFVSDSSANISTNAVPTFETQQQAPASTPTAVEQQTQPVPSAPQEASGNTEAAHAVTPFTARNFTNAEARKGYIDGFAEKLAETIGISKRDLLNR